MARGNVRDSLTEEWAVEGLPDNRLNEIDYVKRELHELCLTIVPIYRVKLVSIERNVDVDRLSKYCLWLCEMIERGFLVTDNYVYAL